jgi:hypothetical protein
MSKSLKAANKGALACIAAANFVLFVALLHWNAWNFREWESLTAEARRAIPTGVALIFIGIINAQLSADSKARVIFARWRDPLPGSRAFTTYLNKDPRINVARLAEAFGPLPTDPREQNAKWYALYKSVETDPAVVHVHREFLFARDYACISALMLLVLTPLAIGVFPSRRIAITYGVILLAQFLLVARAGRHHGARFVTTVLALKGAGR